MFYESPTRQVFPHRFNSDQLSISQANLGMKDSASHWQGGGSGKHCPILKPVPPYLLGSIHFSMSLDILYTGDF